jgi:spore coat polysaccharide biosynthesis protein SpsF
MNICGGTMLERVIERTLQSKVDRVVVAAPHDLPCSVPLFIGDEQDVLKRYYDCADFFEADIVVRITSDCPLIDPKIIDLSCEYFNQHDYQYVTFAPVDGLDVEVFSFELLKEAHENATSKEDREHVTPYMKRKTKISVDNAEDLERVRKIWNGKIR